MKEKIKIIIAHIKNYYQIYVIDNYKSIIETAKSSTKERNRILILTFSLIFVFDYLVFCLHIEKNIFDIFPSIPLLEQRQDAVVFLPSIESDKLLKEQRKIPYFESDENTAEYLFEMVVKGSFYENTSMMVPAKLNVRRVWIYERGASNKCCVIDVDANFLKGNSVVVPGSENLFRKAVAKTITQNIPSVKEVILLEKGIPGKLLWEI